MMSVFCLRAAVVLLAFLSGVVQAAGPQSSGSISLGYRVDSLDWNINGAGNPAGSEPNILSELEWNDLDIFQIRGELSGSNGNGIYFRGLASYGWVMDGQNRDSDYAGDNRSLEFSRSVNDVDDSRVLDLSGGLGLIFPMGKNEQWQIIPMIGYSYHQQDLRMSNGNQVVSNLANFQVYVPGVTRVLPVGPFPGLDSSYNAEWYGPWVGTDILLDLKESGTVFMRLEGHLVNYFAQANWNLRSDFDHPVSFEHEADGQGWVFELGWQEAPSRYYWVWGVSFVAQSWTTDDGTVRTFFSDGGVRAGKLNEVNWSSNSINITLRKSLDN